MITLDNVTKFYIEHGKKKYIVKNSSLVIPDSVNVAILGQKGAGRTTLLKMLAGIDFPTSGTIVSNNTFSWTVGQVTGFKMEITIRQNIKFVGRIYGKSKDEITKIIAEVQNFSEMGDYLDKPMKESLPPMRQQIAFGLSLAFDFDYLLVDNMFAVTAGSEAFRVKSKAALRQKMKSGNVLMVTHSIADIEDVCDVCVVMDKETLHYFDDLQEGILFYKKCSGFAPPLAQKAVQGTIYCEDGNSFKNINLAAKHYKVRPLSILQALNENSGSHVYLKKVFWDENGSKRAFQNWFYTREQETLISSDGVIFRNVVEASRFYRNSSPEAKLDKDHVRIVLQEKNGYSEALDVTFSYLSENE